RRTDPAPRPRHRPRGHRRDLRRPGPPHDQPSAPAVRRHRDHHPPPRPPRPPQPRPGPWRPLVPAACDDVVSGPSQGGCMPYVVDFEKVSTAGLESSPVAEALAGLRANEARYYRNKYDHAFTVSPVSEEPETLDWVHGVLAQERDLVISARPLEVTSF